MDAGGPSTGRLARLIRFAPAVLLLIGLGAAFATGAVDYLSLGQLQTRREELLAIVEDRPLLSLGIYFAVYAVVVTLSVPGASIVTMAGGFLFGLWLGGSAAVLGATLGGTVVFLAMRTAVGDALQARLGGRIAKLEAGLRANAFSYLLTLRLLPVVPFWLANLAAGCVDMRVRTFVTATLLGIIPGTFIYAGIGSGLGSLFERGVRPNLGIVFQPQILLPLIGLALLSLAPVVVRRVRGRRAPAA